MIDKSSARLASESSAAIERGASLYGEIVLKGIPAIKPTKSPPESNRAASKAAKNGHESEQKPSLFLRLLFFNPSCNVTASPTPVAHRTNRTTLMESFSRS